MTASRNRNPAFRFAKLLVKRSIFRLDALFDRLREPSVSGREKVYGLDTLSGIYPSTILVVRPGPSGQGYVKLGKGTYLGRRVELEAGEIELGEGVTIQDGGAVRGHVSIGSHCMIGHNALILSSTHNFRIQPEWLICDQDQEIQRNIDQADGPARVWIDEDCWLGWSCCVMPGVHVGRGAILSANSLVTNDVGPYEIHSGIPNRKIGDRLVFLPPAAINALDDASLPYFYSGFCHRRSSLAESRASGVIDGNSQATIVLAGRGGNQIRLEGVRHDRDGEMRLRFWWNGMDAGIREVTSGHFSLVLQKPDENTPRTGFVPPGLTPHTCLAWTDETGQTDPHKQPDARRYGIARAELN